MNITKTLRTAAILFAALLIPTAACHNDNGVTADDGRLRAAAGRAVITPTAENHPEPVFLGGIYPARRATGVHDDLLASALALRQGSEQVVLVSLDFLGFTRTRTREIQERLTAAGLVGEHVLIASTHTHEAPDTMGVFGPNLLTSGVSPAYMDFVQDTIVDLVLDTWDRLEPVTMRAASARVHVAESNFPSLIADSREPAVTVDRLSAAVFVGAEGEGVATLVNWHSHPEVMIESTLVSSDFPRWTRERLESRLGGTSVYISGAIGGLSSPTGVDVPARDDRGDPVLDDSGAPLLQRAGTWAKTRSLGFLIADLAVEALEGAPVVTAPDLEVVVEEFPMPVQNPIMLLAFGAGLLEYDVADLIEERPAECGPVGCLSERLGLVRFGPVTLVTSPGETFPETWIGRPGTTIDFGVPWGVRTFPALEGIVEQIETGVPMHMSVCGDEIGYLIPETDFHPPGHPDYYEEDLYLSRGSETLYREGVAALLKRMGESGL